MRSSQAFSCEELADQRFGDSVFLTFDFGGSGLAGAKAQRLRAQVAGGAHGQIQVVHLGFGVGLLEAGNDIGCQCAGNGIGASDGRVDVQDLHIGTYTSKNE